ncbi:MAG: SprB repeat-containing protein, partial [Bacteroidota bacterium]
AHVSVKAVSGSVIVSNLTALVPSTSWANNANYVNPSESPGFDYINFGLTSLGTNAFTYSAGVEVHLFTFQNAGTCAGAIDLVEAGDPFYPPNSQNANIGNQLTTLGGGGGNNVWSNNYDQGNSNCLGAPVCDVAISGVTATSPSNCGVNNGSISVTASGTAPLEFSINNGATWQSSNSFTGLAGGNYIIKVRNAICEVAWANNPAVLTAPSAPVISNVTATNPTACGANNGFIGITATGGSGSFEYSINGGGAWASSGNFANLSPGNFDVRVRNANGSCEVTGGIFNLTAPNSLTLSVSKTNPTVCNATDGSITVTASGGTGNYQFSKDGGATWQSGNVFSGLAAGSFQIMARNVGGSCSTSYPSNPVVLNNPSCAPGCLIEYTLERFPNGKYQVSMTPDTTWTFPQNITSSAQVTIVAPAGGFTVTGLFNLLPGVTFANNANYNAPAENPGKKYLVFGLTTTGTTNIPYQKGVKVPLFNFENSAICTGDSVFLMPDIEMISGKFLLIT